MRANKQHKCLVQFIPSKFPHNVIVWSIRTAFWDIKETPKEPRSRTGIGIDIRWFPYQRNKTFFLLLKRLRIKALVHYLRGRMVENVTTMLLFYRNRQGYTLHDASHSWTARREQTSGLGVCSYQQAAVFLLSFLSIQRPAGVEESKRAS